MSMPLPSEFVHQRARVLYDPVGLLPGWRDAAATLTGERRSALNAALIRHLALPDYAPPTPEQAQWTQRLLRGWDAIPAAAFLLACSAWGEQRLAGLPAFRRFEPQVHAFLQHRLPVVPPMETDVPATRAELVDWGGACVLASLPALPAWLHARIALRFRALPAVLRLPTAQPGDLLCFSMALSHAQKDSGFSRSIRP